MAKVTIEEAITRMGLNKYVEEIVIPMESQVKMVKGQKKVSQKKFYPGYIFVKAHLTNEVIVAITSVTKVSGFMGGKTTPSPLTEEEFEKLNQRMEAGETESSFHESFTVGDKVDIVDGPFSSFSGTVEEVFEEKSKLVVELSIFGRSTPVELDYVQVKKG